MFVIWEGLKLSSVYFSIAIFIEIIVDFIFHLLWLLGRTEQFNTKFSSYVINIIINNILGELWYICLIFCFIVLDGNLIFARVSVNVI